MIYATVKGVFAFLTIVGDGEHPLYYPQVQMTVGASHSVEVPELAEGPWWPKKEYMQGWLLSDDSGFMIATIDYSPHAEDNIDLTLWPYNPLDQNFDGFQTGDDYDLFVQHFFAGDLSADFDGNYFINGDDYDLFAELWNR